MDVNPFIWVVVGLMTLFGLVLGWATWETRDR
jgi:hypothetical protein